VSNTQLYGASVGMDGKASEGFPYWGLAAATEILRAGYSELTIAQLTPKLLRIVAETQKLELRPMAALYLNASDHFHSIIAGCYNAEWPLLDAKISSPNDIQSTWDIRSQSTRIIFPMYGDANQRVGAIAFYSKPTKVHSREQMVVITHLVRMIAIVVREKQLQEKRSVEADAYRDASLWNSAIEPGENGSNVLGLLRTTIDHFPGGICVLSKDLTVKMTNTRFYELFDLPEDTFPPGCNFVNILRYNAERGEYGPGDPEQIAAERSSHMRLFIEHVFDRPTTAGRIIEARTSPSPGGGCVLTYVDVTARRLAERELQNHRDTLEETVQARTRLIESQAEELKALLEHQRQINDLQRQFVAMASHEFRTPLTIIDGAARRLGKKEADLSPDYVNEKVGQIRSAVSRMVELMESILVVGRLEDGKTEMQFEDCVLADIIGACCRRNGDVNKTHRFHLDLAHLPDSIIGNKSALEQVFTNLISNAVKYAPEAPDIFVTGHTEDGHVHISVRDEGIGIDPDDLPKMFQRYYRARTSAGIAGTGIGLNLVKQIVELHNGLIVVASKEGNGSTFTVTLPVARTENQESHAATSDAA
jgi:signal transduction histidine kinase